MKRIVFPALVLLLVSGVAAYGIHWLLQVCRPLDRLFGMSGCAEIIRIADFDPLEQAALSAPDPESQASLFGYTRTVDGWRPSLIRLDFGERRELARYPIRALSGFGGLTFAEDGRRAVFVCLPATPCLEDGSSAAILSVEDGAILETREKADDDYVYFPGDPRPEISGGWVQVFAAGGERIVDVRRDDTIGLLDSSGQPVATLFDGRRNDVLASGLSVSPSGERIALFDYARDDIPARLYVWEAATGAMLLERELGPGYRWRFTPTWMRGETHLILMRRDGRDTLLDLHHVP